MEHGTRKMYRDGACRCAECRAWNAAAKRRYDAMVKERDGLTVTQKYRPGKTRKMVAPCSSCGRRVWGESESPTCAVCRKRAKRGIEISAADRLAIYERDGWTCGICLEPVDKALTGHDQFGPTLDHIQPRSLGGSDDHENLRLAHRACNSARGNRAA